MPHVIIALKFPSADLRVREANSSFRRAPIVGPIKYGGHSSRELTGNEGSGLAAGLLKSATRLVFRAGRCLRRYDCLQMR